MTYSCLFCSDHRHSRTGRQRTLLVAAFGRPSRDSGRAAPRTVRAVKSRCRTRYGRRRRLAWVPSPPGSIMPRLFIHDGAKTDNGLLQVKNCYPGRAPNCCLPFVEELLLMLSSYDDKLTFFNGKKSATTPFYNC